MMMTKTSHQSTNTIYVQGHEILVLIQCTAKKPPLDGHAHWRSIRTCIIKSNIQGRSLNVIKKKGFPYCKELLIKERIRSL